MSWFKPKKQARSLGELAWACCWMAIKPDRTGSVKTFLGSNITKAASEDAARGKTWETLIASCPPGEDWVGHMIGVLPIIYENTQKEVQQEHV